MPVDSPSMLERDLDHRRWAGVRSRRAQIHWPHPLVPVNREQYFAAISPNDRRLSKCQPPAADLRDSKQFIADSEMDSHIGGMTP